MHLISQKDSIGTVTNFTTDFSWFLSLWMFTLSNSAFIISVSGPRIMACVPANPDQFKDLSHISYKMIFNFMWFSLSAAQWGRCPEKQNASERLKWREMPSKAWVFQLAQPLHTTASAVPREAESSGLILFSSSYRNRIPEISCGGGSWLGVGPELSGGKQNLTSLLDVKFQRQKSVFWVIFHFRCFQK